jgi:hypothetical protein
MRLISMLILTNWEVNLCNPIHHETTLECLKSTEMYYSRKIVFHIVLENY